MPAIEDAPAELLTTSEVANLLRVSKATVARWANEGRLPVIQPSPRILRFRRIDVETLMGEAS